MNDHSAHSLRKNHIHSIVISVLMNGLLMLLLLYAVQLPSQMEEERVSIRMQTEEPVTEEVMDPGELEDPELTDVEDSTLNMDSSLDVFAEMETDTDAAVDIESNIIPTMSPVKMLDMALQTGPVTLSGAGIPGKGATRFMGQQGEGERIAFVIDYSRSMNNTQLAVMKYELYTAVQKIGESGLVSMLFFSGPVWRPDQDAEEATQWWTGSNGNGWRVRDGEEGPNPQWFLPDRNNLAAIQRMIYNTPTTYGTDWYPPLKLALEMNPRPDVIFFMTDGNSPSSSVERTLKMVEDIPSGTVQINTVALGLKEEKAEPLKSIAEQTGGHFRLYTSTQLKEAEEALPKPPEKFSDQNLRYMSSSEVLHRSLENSQKGRPAPVENDDVVTFEI